jgi:hypothetical protein
MSQEQPQDPTPKQEEEPKLPPLSPQDFKVFNQKAEQMEYFVSHPASFYMSIQFKEGSLILTFTSTPTSASPGTSSGTQQQPTNARQI